MGVEATTEDIEEFDVFCVDGSESLGCQRDEGCLAYCRPLISIMTSYNLCKKLYVYNIVYGPQSHN